MILVGSTGFVGSNLLLNGKFDAAYHSTDVDNSYGSRPDILVYAGVTGTKFWANSNPDKDKDVIEKAKKNIMKIAPSHLVLISSVDVNERLDSDENYEIKESQFGAYGNNRLELEKWVQGNFAKYNIIRLPAIYGQNLKKNFVHDLISPIPPMLSKDLYEYVIQEIPLIVNEYELKADGYYHYLERDDNRNELTQLFGKSDFNALSFTNPQNYYQYYNLEWLWEDINTILYNDIKLINLVTEPIGAEELYYKVYKTKKCYKCRTSKSVKYDLKTQYSGLFSGNNGYIYSKEKVLQDLIKFIKNQRKIG